jgi:biopolymer transport protein ExbD
MVTMSFRKTERELDPAVKVQKPSASQAASDLAPPIVEIVRGGSGTFVYKLGGRETTSLTELTDVLRQFDNKFDGAIVRAQDDAPFDMAASAIQACKDARFLLVTYQPLDRGR